MTRAASKIHEKSIEVPRKQYTLPEKRQQIIVKLTLV